MEPKENTVNTRNYTMKLFLLKYNKSDIEVYDKVKEFINNIQNPRSKKTHLNNIMQLCQNKDQYTELFTQVVNNSNMLTFHRKPTSEETSNYETWTNIIAKRDSLPKESNEYLLLCFYTMIPPMRNEELFSIHINDDTKNNYNTEKQQLTIMEAKVCTKRVLNLPKNLVEVLSEYIKNNNISDGSVLFPFKSSKSITQILTKIFGHNFGSSMIRKIFVSTFTKNMDVKEKCLLAHAMNHQPMTQYLVYTRFPTNGVHNAIDMEELKLSHYMNLEEIVDYTFLI